MKATNRKMTKWLVLGGLLALAGMAYADFNVQNKGSYFNNASTGARTTAAGHATVAESDPPMDANLTFTNIMSATLAAGAADSSSVLDTHRMRLGTLLIKGVPAGGTGTHTRLAIQIRTHLAGQDDSSSTFVIYLNPGKNAPAIASGSADTVGTGHELTGSATAAWSGEFDVAFARNRNAPGSLAAAVAYSYPSGIAIPLTNIFGMPIYSEFTSIRIRNLVGPTITFTAHLIGTPL